MSGPYNSTIAVCLASYNGESFIAEQLDSILVQTVKTEIFIRDDGSSDCTTEIVENYSEKYSNIHIFEVGDYDKRSSSKNNFSSIIENLIENHCFQYFFLCDQDDVWVPDKVKQSLDYMYEVEKETDKPVLIYSDLQIVDRNLNSISNYFFCENEPFIQNRSLGQLLVQNYVPGCSMLLNKPLVEKAFPIPSGAIMHDWWIVLIASTFGRISYLNKPLVLYRQHDGNEIGINNSLESARYLFKKILNREDLFQKYVIQAKEFYSIFYTELSQLDRDLLENFIKLTELPRCKRFAIFFRFKFFKNEALKSLGLLVYLMIHD